MGGTGFFLEAFFGFAAFADLFPFEFITLVYWIRPRGSGLYILENDRYSDPTVVER